MSSEQTAPKTAEPRDGLDLGYWTDFAAQIADRSDADLSEWIECDLAELEIQLSKFASPGSRVKNRG